MYTKEEIAEAGLDDFRIFLYHVWEYLGLPEPTPAQLDFAKQLQHGPKSYIACGFRGVGKSWITVAFVLWLLFMDPQLKVLVVSANEKLAQDFTKFARQLIDGMPLLQHLKPRPGQKDNAHAFDVGPATDSKDPSVKSAGITGQITGNRADIIISDDIEVPKNSFTHVLRERLAELIKEFDAVLKPGGRVVYLGTPQNESSVYMKLLSRGYRMLIWPVEVPARPEIYGDRLAPFVKRMIERGVPVGTPVEPLRFDRDEIDRKMASYGRAGFALQFMLDTNPSDADKHPLKARNLLVDDVDASLGYVKLVWGSDQVVQDLQCGGFDGDCYVRPMWRSEEMVPWQGTVFMVDPSGKGQDETAYAIVRYCHGMLYLVDSGGFKDGFSQETLRALAVAAVSHKATVWYAEPNYGGGMFVELLKPVLARVAEEMKLVPPTFDEEYNGWSQTNKELRICDTLEPVLAQHRLVVDRKVIEKDLHQQAEAERYSLIYQLTRMGRIKGEVPNEDRLEALSMAVGYWTDRMNRDADKQLQAHKDEKLDKELRRYMEHVITVGHRPRGKDPRSTRRR